MEAGLGLTMQAMEAGLGPENEAKSTYFCDITCTSQQGQCHYNSSQSGASMSGSVSIASGNEDDLLAAVATVGPISAVVDATSNAFRVCLILG